MLAVYLLRKVQRRVVLAWGYGRLLVKLSKRRESPDSLDKRKGYSLSDARGYWTALGEKGRAAEERFMWWDLSYPLAYGGALCAGVLVACADRPKFHYAFIEPTWLPG